jgi:hypothetical protein
LLVRVAVRCAAVLAFAVVWCLAGSARATPAVEGSRNLSMGAARASSYGTNAALINPSNMAFAQVFAIEPMYQLHLPSRTHGIGFVVMDSLNNPRVALALGYAFMRGSPRISFTTMGGDERNVTLSRFGHEVLGALSVTAVKNWLSFGLKPKYQYVSYRYRDDEGIARDAHRKLNAFGLDTSATVFFGGYAALALIGNNVTGNKSPPFTDERDARLEGFDPAPETIDHGSLTGVSDYPLTFEHGLAVFPLRHPDFSINFDGVYDFSTYRHKKRTRMLFSGGAEYVIGPVPLRVGVTGDLRDDGRADDRVYVSGGIAYVKPPKLGGIGVDVGFGFRQQVSGPDLGPSKETFLGFNVGLRIHPDL